MCLTLQVIAGLKKHVKKEELENSLVVLILNLKPAKLAGQLSEAMVLAGVSPLPGGGELVRAVRPPGDSLLVSPLLIGHLLRIPFPCFVVSFPVGSSILRRVPRSVCKISQHD